MLLVHPTSMGECVENLFGQLANDTRTPTNNARSAIPARTVAEEQRTSPTTATSLRCRIFEILAELLIEKSIACEGSTPV
jgi:hypothetical protein